MEYNTSLFEQCFEEQFEVVKANTDELLAICKKLRYQVFCEERMRFDPKAHSNRLEEDNYDEHSLQTLLKDKVSGEYIATARLILSREPGNNFSYPLEECITRYNHVAIDMIKTLPKFNTAEVSRFAISKHYRQSLKRVSNAANGARNAMGAANFDCLVTVGLIKSLIKMSAENNVTNWLAFMEPSLLRLLSRLGIHFETHGPLINHCGKRYACKKAVGDMLKGVKLTKPEAWRLITDNGKITIH